MPQKLIDISGQRFGRLVVSTRAPNTTGDARWHCICDCGSEIIAWSRNLRTGNTPSCGCIKREDKPLRQADLTGQRFGRLQALVLAPRSRPGNREWLCMCDCGVEKLVRSDRLRSGETISCGCAVEHRTSLRPQRVQAVSAAQKQTRKALLLNVGGRFTADQIDDLHAKQREKCANCRANICPKTYHRDHRVALSRGGTNDISNIQLLCIPCNRRKYNKDPIEFAQAEGRLL